MPNILNEVVPHTSLNFVFIESALYFFIITIRLESCQRFKPGSLAKYDSSVKVSFRDYVDPSFRKGLMYHRQKGIASVLFHLFLDLLCFCYFLIFCVRISVHRIKIYDDSGSPCLQALPRCISKKSDKYPFRMTLDCIFV